MIKMKCLTPPPGTVDLDELFSTLTSVIDGPSSVDIDGVEELGVAAFEHLPQPAIIVGEDGTIVTGNAAVRTLGGFSPAGLAGQPYWHVLSPREGRRRGEKRPYLLRGTGSTLAVLVRVVPLSAVEGASPVLMLIEQEPSRPTASLSVMPDDGALLLEAAHELRSPLMSFNLGLAGLADESGAVSAGDRLRLLGALQQSMVHLQTVVENLLDAASIGAQRFTLRRAEVDMAEVIRESASIVEPLRATGQQQIVLDLPATPLLVDADGQRVRQVLVNLLHNAIKYGPRDETITVRARHKRGELKIKVIDRGPGIPAGERKRIFQRFYRGRNATGSGSGLGLAIVQAIVEAHGGEIGVQHDKRTGTCFWFSIPTAQ